MLWLRGFEIRYTQKQIDKYQRQKYIAELEKVSKNLFRMFRNKEIGADSFVEKFTQLKERLAAVGKIPLDLEYYRELEAYIDRLYHQIASVELFGNTALDEIREIEMGNLNRLQKLKNGKSYKKTKHKKSGENWE